MSPSIAKSEERLTVIIAGAGICGLAVGAAVREFADVIILEAAPEIGEIGAAVHLAPNSHRIIKALGGDLIEKYGSVPCTGYREWSPQQVLKIDVKFDPLIDNGCEWALCHRVDVQKELWHLATTEEKAGAPCVIKLNERVVDVDVEGAVVRTAKGGVYKGDVVIAADGIKSIIRPFVAGKVTSKASGHSAYRTLVPAEKIRNHPVLSELGLLEDRISTVDGGDRRIICYPCRDRTMLNFVCALPDSELNEISEEKWTAKGDVSSLVKSFGSFAQVWQDLLAQADVVGLYQLRDQDPLDTWVKGRTILVGDSAHSMLPHQGQGASQALEDAEAIGTILSSANRSSIPEALQQIFRARYKRATYTQVLSRTLGLGDMRKKHLDLGNGQEAPNLDPLQYRQWQWQYYGVEQWQIDHPDWVLSA